jgi:hypothetical protein
MRNQWVRGSCFLHLELASTGLAIDGVTCPKYLDACTQHHEGVTSRLVRNVTDKAGPHYLLTIGFNHPSTRQWVPCDRLIAMEFLWHLFGISRPDVQGQLPNAEDRSWKFRMLVQDANSWRPVTELGKRSRERGWLSLVAIENAMMAERLDNREMLLEVAN